MSTINVTSLARQLPRITYNGDKFVPPRETKLNIFIGVGLWSTVYGLSQGLPVDIMPMLLTAALTRACIQEANPEKKPRVIILLADSMALRESQDSDQIERITLLYKRSLKQLLLLLNMSDADIMLSSALEKETDYEKTLQTLEETRTLQELKADKRHYAYIHAQTAIVTYMHTHLDVGIKIGWIYACNVGQMQDRGIIPDPKNWDEWRFDLVYKATCPTSTLQFLYTKAGLRQPEAGKDKKYTKVSEGCPYTAYASDCRYVVQTQERQDIKTICSVKKAVADHWISIAQLCLDLEKLQIVSEAILPEGCVQPTNAIATVYTMLSYWSNPLLASSTS